MDKVKVQFLGEYESQIIGSGIHKVLTPGVIFEMEKGLFEREYKSGGLFKLYVEEKKKIKNLTD